METYKLVMGKEERLLENPVDYVERKMGFHILDTLSLGVNEYGDFEYLIKLGGGKEKEDNKKLKVYFASPLFTLQDQMFNLNVYEQILGRIKGLGLEDKVEIYLPQLNEAINDKDAYASAEDILEADCEELRASDLMLGLLDGEDSGVALEAGIAHERGIPMLGLWTDSRQQGGTNQRKLDAVKDIGQNQFMYINLMLSGAFLASGGIESSKEVFVEEAVLLITELLIEKEMETK